MLKALCVQRHNGLISTRDCIKQMPPSCSYGRDEDGYGSWPDAERVSAAVVSDLLPLSSLAADVQTYDEAFFADVSRRSCPSGKQVSTDSGELDVQIAFCV